MYSNTRALTRSRRKTVGAIIQRKAGREKEKEKAKLRSVVCRGRGERRGTHEGARRAHTAAAHRREECVPYVLPRPFR